MSHSSRQWRSTRVLTAHLVEVHEPIGNFVAVQAKQSGGAFLRKADATAASLVGSPDDRRPGAGTLEGDSARAIRFNSWRDGPRWQESRLSLAYWHRFACLTDYVSYGHSVPHGRC